MALTLTAVFEEVSESEGGGYIAYVEELPGAITESETIEEARENLQDAVNELLEANRTRDNDRESAFLDYPLSRTV